MSAIIRWFSGTTGAVIRERHLDIREYKLGAFAVEVVRLDGERAVFKHPRGAVRVTVDVAL